MTDLLPDSPTMGQDTLLLPLREALAFVLRDRYVTSMNDPLPHPELAEQSSAPPALGRAAPRPQVISFGCRLNGHEADIMADHAAAAGLAETIVVNTCAVTGEAVRKAEQTIRRLRRDNPDSRIIVTGCAAQIDPDRFARMAEVDHVIGNAEKVRRTTFETLSLAQAPRVLVNDARSMRETAGHIAITSDRRTRGFVEVQNGCDHRCTFCIIPYARGPSRSTPLTTVVDTVTTMVANGTREIVLTGVDLTSYGQDLPGTPRLGRLVTEILRRVPSLPRLRLSSIDSIECDPELINAIADESRLMPHLHLSLQSGDDLILKRMKRRHSRADAIQFSERIRHLRSDIVFGADIIAGFPTETDAMFENSLSLIDACQLTYVHVFPYSPRVGTPAARMPQVPSATIANRAARMRAMAQARLFAHLDAKIGTSVEVLTERGDRGYTPDYAAVAVPAPPGQLALTRINARRGSELVGEILS
jgi:threonylcarbamoyladenosine tRNA methylthiotransferase MtaB